MKLSIITVCLNSEKTIEDTIKSVLEQDYPDLEYIIFDGGSTDKTIETISSYGDNIRLIQAKDSGIFNAMNQALGRVTGEVIGFLNSDDFYTHSGTLSMVMKCFKNKKLDSVYGDLHYVYRDRPDKIYRVWKSAPFNRQKFRFGWTVPHPSFFVKKQIYDYYGLFDDTFKSAGDYELAIRFLYKHKISTQHLPEVLVKMRRSGISNGSVTKTFFSLKECHKALKQNGLSLALGIVFLKPIRKIPQLVQAKFHS